MSPPIPRILQIRISIVYDLIRALDRVAERHGSTPAPVALACLIARGTWCKR
ncbi:aryl-alcohol dehydrogenase-like predicted oxidoreductase [Paraburkholderia sp. GAS348]